MSRIDAIQISPQQTDATLSPAQKRFNTLIRQIEQARQTLTAWQDNMVLFRQAYAQKLQPLQDQLLASHRQWVFALDAALAQKNWTKTERATLREVLCDEVEQVLNALGDDPELEALYDKHAEVDFSTQQREAMLLMKTMAQAATGLDLGDDEDIETEDDLIARVQQGLADRAEAEQQARQAATSAKPARQRKKSAAQLRQEAEAQQATQSLREIYRKLASALHPDRETDAQQREEKTRLMQRVNQAYAAEDLLALLELQLQIEQIDASHMASASADRLKHYNKVLAEQLGELRLQINHMEMAFYAEFGLQPARRGPQALGPLLEQTRRQWEAELTAQARDTRMLGDVAQAKRWLKRQRQAYREEDYGFGPF